METLAMQIGNMVACLPQEEQRLVFEVVRRFIPDDVATPDDVLAIELARAEYERGETVIMDAINWD